MSNKSKRDFVNNLSYDIFKYVIVGIIYGSIGLYTCKIAQSNVLPDNMDQVPFGSTLTSFGGDSTDHSIIANVSKEYDWHGMGWLRMQDPIKIQGQRIEFDNKQVLDTYFNGFYGTLYKNKYSSSNLALYYYNIFGNLFSMGNMITNKLFQFFNTSFPEWMILVLFPFIVHKLGYAVGIIHIILSGFFHITHLKDFFLKKVERDPSDESVPHLWEEYDKIQYLKLFPILTVMFFLFSGGIWFSVMTVGAMSFLSWILTPFYVSFYKENDPNHEKPLTVFQYIADVVSSHWQLILVITSLITLSNTNKHLGKYYTIGVLIAILIAIMHNMYNQKIPENTEFPFSDIDPNAAYTQKPKTGDIGISEEEMYTILMGRFKPPANV